MNNTPQANRVHIGIFGRCNSGKSSLINAIAGQEIALVSGVAGTTTDPVIKSMEINDIGACVLIDTAGFDDKGELGSGRKEKSRKAADKSDVALIVCTDDNLDEESVWYDLFKSRGVPVIVLLNKSDLIADIANMATKIEAKLGVMPIAVSAKTGDGIDKIISAIAEQTKDINNPISITGNLVEEGDVVVLVMPQDKQAPKGRLILPQVQTIRDLLDKKCVAISCVPQTLEKTLRSLKIAPKLIVTDSQVFDEVSKIVPKETKLTSFSVLMACYKGDAKSFIEGVKAIDNLTSQSRILIAEACTHAPMNEDIGREKIPAALRKRVGEDLQFDIVGGADFPTDLSSYDLIIHCGACMFNRRHVLTRIAEAKKQNVPITNYGITLAYLNSILDKIVFPK